MQSNLDRQWRHPPLIPPAGQSRALAGAANPAPNGQNAAPFADVITRWIAPYSGTITITGQLQHQGSGKDPLLATLYLVNQANAPVGTMLWQRTVNWNDAGCTPVDAGQGVLGSDCSTTNGAGYTRTVTKGDRIYTRVGAISNANQDGLYWNTTINYTPSSQLQTELSTKEGWGPYRYQWVEGSDEYMAGAYYTPWTATFSGIVDLSVQINKVSTADNIGIAMQLYRPSDGTTVTIGGHRPFPSSCVDQQPDDSSETFTYCAAPNSGVVQIDAGQVTVNPGDQIHVTVKSDTPINPQTIKVLTLAQYTWLCRNNPFGGAPYCGTPACTQHVADNGSDCILNGSGPDPQVATPLSGSQVAQVVPTYYPLQKWVYQATTTPNPPTTTLDGRSRVSVPIGGGNQTPAMCYRNNSPTQSSQLVTLMIQTPGQLLAKRTIDLHNAALDGSLCLTGPAQGPGTQVIFSAYTSNSLPANAQFLPTFNGALVTNPNNGLEVYLPDSTYPKLTTFPFIGGVENMASGYHDFYMGLWNGNAAFNEGSIAGLTTTANYAPLTQAPMPVPPSTSGSGLVNAFDFGIGSLISFVEDVAGAVASFGEYIWDNVSHLLKFAGSMVIGAVRWSGSILGKVFAWAMCEIGGEGYTADGIRLTENHNKQEAVSNGVAGKGVSHGFSLSGLDLIDMNGDRYPDQVSTQGIRYAYFDPPTNTWQFCAAPASSLAGCATSGTPQVGLPTPSYLRDIRHSTHTVNFGVDITAIIEAVATLSSGTDSNGVEPSISLSTDASQSFSRTNRDLIDINGDGLPDIVDVGSTACSPTATRNDLCVRLNYGYGFSAPILWKSSAWSIDAGGIAAKVPTLLNSLLADVGATVYQAELDWLGLSLTGAELPTSKTIRLEEEGHKGGQITIGPVGGGSDDSYSRKLVDLVDVNGDGLPDQIMKLPNDSYYHIKLNTGSGFDGEFSSDAIAWPALNVWFSDSSVSVASTDSLEFVRNYTSDDSFNVAAVYGDSEGNGSRHTIIEMMDIDGDGRLDQVMKNADYSIFSGAADPTATQMWARLNQVGSSNLLSGVTLPLGGSYQISYNRQGNFVGTQQFPSGESVNVDMQEARWTMSQCLTNDGRGNQTENNFYYSLGYFDRGEREFFGFAQVQTTHGSVGRGGPINGDGSYELQFFRNQTYYERGMPYATYVVEPFGQLESGTVYTRTFSNTPNASNSRFVTGEGRVDEAYDRTVQLFANPTTVFSGRFPVTQAPVAHYTVRGWSPDGLSIYVDFGDLTSTTDDVIYNLQYTTYPGITHLTALTHIDERTNGSGQLLAQRDATYTVTNNRPQLTTVSDRIINGYQPVTGTLYTGTAAQIQTTNITYNTADLGNIATYTDPTGYKLTYTYDSATKTHVTGVSDSFSLTSSRTMNQDYGLPATTTDVNSKVVTYNYDSYGRLSKVWAPGDPTTGQATIQMTYSQGGAAAATPWAMTQHKDFQSTNGTTIDTVAFADGLGRIIQTKKKADLLQSNGTTAHGYDITGLIVWDLNGRVMAQSQPFFDSATAETTLVPAVSKNPTVFTYDALNRVTSASTADGAMTQTVYGALLPTPQDPGDPLPNFTGQLSLERITDANGSTTRIYRDGAGRIMVNMDAGFSVTSYGYDLLNNLSKVTDNGGNVTSGTYDSLSRLVVLSSTATGETDWRYALTGLLQEKQTANLRANSKVIKYGYTTNRLTTITYPFMPPVTYAYGMSGRPATSSVGSPA